jgi:hypothetical protein
MSVLDRGRKLDPRRFSIVVGVAMALTVALAVVTLGGPNSAEASSLARFDKAGKTKWTVPAGVHRITIDVYGASGGHYVADNTIQFTGGLGGEAKGTFNVTPGQVLLVVVGGRGSDLREDGSGIGVGYNGGGIGGHGGYGGGGSDVRIGGTGNRCIAAGKCTGYDRIIVGGGGGGAGAAENGLDGGGVHGVGHGVGPYDRAGQEPVEVNSYCDANSQYFAECFYSGGNASSGGGGGWFGGSGGNAPQGGGGGSGYVSPLAVSGSFPGGTRSGDGLVVIKAA